MKHTVPAGANMPFSGCKYAVPAGAKIPFLQVHLPFQRVYGYRSAGAKYRSGRCMFCATNRPQSRVVAGFIRCRKN